MLAGPGHHLLLCFQARDLRLAGIKAGLHNALLLLEPAPVLGTGLALSVSALELRRTRHASRHVQPVAQRACTSQPRMCVIATPGAQSCPLCVVLRRVLKK